MKFFGQIFLWFVGVIIFITALDLIALQGDLLVYKVIEPQRQEVEREIFEETKSYVHGTIRDLRDLQVEYSRADTDAERAVIRETVLHRIAAFDRDELPEDLREFVNTLEEEQRESG